MKIAVALSACCTALVVAAPAWGEPVEVVGDDDSFLAAVQQHGIRFGDPARAAGAGRAVCDMLNNGESGLELVHDLKVRNPGFDMESASDFAMVSAKFYCPHHLSKS